MAGNLLLIAAYRVRILVFHDGPFIDGELGYKNVVDMLLVGSRIPPHYADASSAPSADSGAGSARHRSYRSFIGHLVNPQALEYLGA
jgi:hypothetical protein